MNNKDFLTVAELARILGISRVAIFKKIKKGVIKAQKIGRNFAIRRKDIGDISGNELKDRDKREIDKAIEKTVKQYGETLRMLGEE
jgi:excisionase family DNA binding protein